DLVALQVGQTLQPHVEDGPGLNLGELEAGHQGVLRGIGALGPANELDDDVELLDRFSEPGPDMRFLLGSGEVEAGAPGDDLPAEANERFQHLLEVDHLRPTIDQRQHDDAEGGLHLRVLIQLVHHDLRDLAPSELEHDADALAVRLVADLGEAIDPLVPRQLGDFFDQARLVHLIRQLRDDDGFTAAPQLLGMGLGPQREAASPRRVGLTNSAYAVDGPGRWICLPHHVLPYRAY